MQQEARRVKTRLKAATECCLFPWSDQREPNIRGFLKQSMGVGVEFVRRGVELLIQLLSGANWPN